MGVFQYCAIPPKPHAVAGLRRYWREDSGPLGFEEVAKIAEEHVIVVLRKHIGAVSRGFHEFYFPR